jgi:hypothetical protein
MQPAGYTRTSTSRTSPSKHHGPDQPVHPSCRPPLNLGRCDPRGHTRARTEYNCDVKKGMDLIDSGLAEQAVTPTKMCRILLGDFRANCCQTLGATALARCQQGVEANAQLDQKCAFTPPCRRKLLCPIAWTIEEKRSQCCVSLKPQGVKLLKQYCQIRVSALTASCSETKLPTEGYVTIQPVGTAMPIDAEVGGVLGPLPERQQD